MRETRLFVCLMTLSLLVPLPVLAGTLGPKRASELVTLSRGATDCPTLAGAFAMDTRILADGSTVPFTIPAKRVLVVTGVQWTQNGAGSAIAGETVLLGLLVGSAQPVLQTVVATPANAFSLAVPIPSGIAVKPGTPLCVIAQKRNPTENLSIGLSATVHGYLAKDK